MLLGLKTSGLGSHREAGGPKSTETRTARKPRDSRIPSCFCNQNKKPFVYLSICLSIYLNLSMYLPTYIPSCLAKYLYPISCHLLLSHRSVDPVCLLSIYPPIYLCIYLWIVLPFCRATHLSPIYLKGPQMPKGHERKYFTRMSLPYWASL